MLKGRQRRIEILRQRLLRKSRPRLQMSLILLLTGLTGFLTSFTLLHIGVPSMAVRYPLAIGMAYCAFLVLLGLWLWLQRHELNPDTSMLDIITSGPGRQPEPFGFGHGGDFGGGGAGGSWGDGVSASDGGGSVANGIGFDVEELGLLVVAVIAGLGGLLATFYVLYIAPSLLAEILVDGALVAGLYRRVKRIHQRHWLRAAVRRTLLPAILVALFLTCAGFALQKAVPEAHTLSDVWAHLVRG